MCRASFAQNQTGLTRLAASSRSKNSGSPCLGPGHNPPWVWSSVNLQLLKSVKFKIWMEVWVTADSCSSQRLTCGESNHMGNKCLLESSDTSPSYSPTKFPTILIELAAPITAVTTFSVISSNIHSILVLPSSYLEKDLPLNTFLDEIQQHAFQLVIKGIHIQPILLQIKHNYNLPISIIQPPLQAQMSCLKRICDPLPSTCFFYGRIGWEIGCLSMSLYQWDWDIVLDFSPTNSFSSTKNAALP